MFHCVFGRVTVVHKMETFREDEKVLEFFPDFPKWNLRALSEPCSKFSLLEEPKGCPEAESDLGDLQGSGFIEPGEQKKTRPRTAVMLLENHG